MKGGVRVSVVIPAHCRTQDHERFLVEALESVAAQSYRDFEVVVVDDFSPVDVTSLIESVAGLPETRIYRNAANLGHAQSRNVGVRGSRGELIAFLDHDDLWLPGKLERQVAELDAHADACLAFCDVEVFGEGMDKWNYRLLDQSSIPDRPDFVWFGRRRNLLITASAVLVKKQTMLDIGLFDSRYSTTDDFDAWLKILWKSAAVHIPEKLVKYRLHGDNVNFSVNRLNDNRLLTRLLWSYWRKSSTVDKIRLLPKLSRKVLVGLYLALTDSGKWKADSG